MSDLAQALLTEVPEDGRSIGNQALFERLKVRLGDIKEDEVRAVRDALIQQGVLVKGRGRGGSVLRAAPSNLSLADQVLSKARDRLNVAPVDVSNSVGLAGSARQNLNKGLVSNHPVLLPPKDVLSAYEGIAGAAIDGWIANEQQSQVLTLRDTLLPRLISGQLRLPEAAALVMGIEA